MDLAARAYFGNLCPLAALTRGARSKEEVRET